MISFTFVAIFVVLTLWDGLILVYVKCDADAFTYFPSNSDSGIGYEDWEDVDQNYQYFPWDKFLNNQGSNECIDHQNSDSSHGQSPIDIHDADDCKDADNGDTHRHWTFPGDCTVEQVSWTIEQWGLLMTFPYPTDGSNDHPKDYICEHPSMDSSGGYGDPFYVNYVSVVSPSEHTIDGEQFDAEINIAHFHESREYPMIFSVLARAKPEYPDNIILEPYLREWDRVHAKTRLDCETLYGMQHQDLRHCPVTSTQLSIGEEQFRLDNGSNNDSKGFMFDLMASSDMDLAINAFDLNVRNSGDVRHKFSVWVRDNFAGARGTHVDYEIGRDHMWTEIASNVETYGNGLDEPSRLTFSQPYLVRKGETIGFYIFHNNDNDLLNASVGTKTTGDVQVSDTSLTLFVGTVVGNRNDSEDTAPFTGPLYQNRGLAGNVYYHKCNLEEDASKPAYDNYRISAQITPKDQEEIAGLTLPNSIAELSSDGFDYVGCFKAGGDGDLNHFGGSITIPQCADTCRENGFKMFVFREGGECFCTDGEFGFEGHAEQCLCDHQQLDPLTVGGSSKQCAFRVKRKYLGCFKNTGAQDTFEVRMTKTSRGLSLPKCQEVCYDAGYRYMGIEDEGICRCGNEPNYDKYGETTGCDCEGQNVGSEKFCAYDLGTGLPEPVDIKDNPLYSRGRYEYLGCFKDTADRALPLYWGRRMYNNKCASRCFNQNHRYFSRQYQGECWCGDGMYDRHGQVDDDECNCNSRTDVGNWRMCLYEFIKEPDQTSDGTPTGASTTDGTSLFQPMQTLDEVRGREWGPFPWAKHPYIDVYRLLTTPWFYRYSGSYTKPMCFDQTRWRIFKEPMQISIRQKLWIDLLIKEMRYPTDTPSTEHICQKGTVGRPRFDFDPSTATDHVDVNRPIQPKTPQHELYVCDAMHWRSQGFYMTPRANTYWNLMEEKNLFTPADHWN